ncbi:AMP-binding protein [Marinithermofilum abyssi]|uniref:AMP-binding protein n=1 Tax=Marinithermofilum abyssi TaxID=1571185 RepID=UPI00166BBF93|nr:AMP-binding protein [Marinithermofilum abyssi]
MKEQQYLKQLRQLWEKNWPSELPKEPHYPFGEVQLTEYLRKWAQINPDKPCIIYYGAELTFQELDDLSDRFAAFLYDRGLKKGDRVAVFLPNCPQYHIVFYGVLKLGCILVPVNPMFKAQELLYELNDTEAKVIVTLDQLFPIVQSVKEWTHLSVVLTTHFADYLPEEPAFTVHESLLSPKTPCPDTMDLLSLLAEQDSGYPRMDVGLDDVVALNYTSGTTGFPKGCAHTQRDMIYTAATTTTFGLNITPDDMGLVYWPIFWIAGEDTGVIVPVFSGTTHILLARWHAQSMLEAIDRYRPTFTCGIVDNFVELMEHPDVDKYNLHSLRSTTVSSFIKKLNPEYRRRWRELTGSIMREAAYGMTETHTVDTFTTGLQENDRDLKSRPVFCGLPMPETELKIVDFETDDLVPLGEEGEIAIRTPSLFKFYWNKPESERALRDGWLYTGDLGVLDEEGFLHFLGRKKEMLKVKGMSVFPAEIEALICGHEAIEACGVVGRSHPEKGEEPVAFVQLVSGYKGKLSEVDLEKWCRENMAGYKVPVIQIIEELPLTATGKVKKEELKNNWFIDLSQPLPSVKEGRSGLV